MKHSKTRKLRKRGGTGEVEAESIYIEKATPEITESSNPTTFSNNFITAQNVKLDDSITDDSITAEPIEAKVLTTTKKKRGLIESIYRKLGKSIGLIPRTTPKADRKIDFNIDKFKGTCLENVTLPIEEIAIIADKMKYEPEINLSIFWYDHISIYCDLRNRMLSYDPEFSKKYPYTYKSLLNSSFDINTDDIYSMVDYVLLQPPSELKEHESELRFLSDSSYFPGNNFMNKVENTLNPEMQSYQLIPKRAGKRNSKKRIKNSKRKTKRQINKHKKIELIR